MNELTSVSENNKNTSQDVQFGSNKVERRKAGSFETFLLFSMVPFIYFGWMIREEEIFAAELGWGYALGIIGGVMMLILMLYPLRKHAKFMRNVGQVRYWFRLHMALGILGPIAILYHANFGFGSINSNVALISMLVVASSGVVGRFIYSKIHYGLYGRKTTFDELQIELVEAKEKIVHVFATSADELMSPLTRFEKKNVALTNNLFFSIFLLPVLPIFSFNANRAFKKNVRTELNNSLNKNKLSNSEAKKIDVVLRSYSKKYLLNTSRMIEFIIYEKIFSLWHMLHLPLFMIMVSTGLFHVYAVHMY